MIVVTRLNDSRFAVNPDLVERIQESPDTTLIMVDGAKYIVTESMAEVIDMIARYRARIVSLAAGLPERAGQQGFTSTGPQLGLVRGSGGAAGPGDASSNAAGANGHAAAPAHIATVAPVADIADMRTIDGRN